MTVITYAILISILVLVAGTLDYVFTRVIARKRYHDSERIPLAAWVVCAVVAGAGMAFVFTGWGW